MRARPLLIATFVVVAVLLPATGPGASATAADRTPPHWVRRIDAVIGNEPVSVVIGYQGQVLYHHKDWVARPPASNEKLLLSMALFDRIGTETTIPTRVLASRTPVNGVLHGDLWIVGHGDPETGPDDLRTLAQDVAALGVTKVRGHVYGATGPFARDWFAPGWKDYFPADYVALPTALTYRYNLSADGRHIADPERRAAVELTKQLRRTGVRVTKRPGMGSPPAGLVGLATVRSDPLFGIVHRMDLWSKNFYAEVLGKVLGTRLGGPPGTIAKGAAALEAFAEARGAGDVLANDGSGLSYDNRVTPIDIVRLLWSAEGAPWGETLRGVLAHGGQGTLQGRLAEVRLRAKTGTLDRVSALSGWVWLVREKAWAEFSILSSGISKTRSIKIENVIVHAVSANAAPRP